MAFSASFWLNLCVPGKKKAPAVETEDADFAYEKNY